jgi:hypothetical protein
MATYFLQILRPDPGTCRPDELPDAVDGRHGH